MQKRKRLVNVLIAGTLSVLVLTVFLAFRGATQPRPRPAVVMRRPRLNCWVNMKRISRLFRPKLKACKPKMRSCVPPLVQCRRGKANIRIRLKLPIRRLVSCLHKTVP